MAELRKHPAPTVTPTLPEDLPQKRALVKDIHRRTRQVLDTDVEAALDDVRALLAGDEQSHDRQEKKGRTRSRTRARD